MQNIRTPGHMSGVRNDLVRNVRHPFQMSQIQRDIIDDDDDEFGPLLIDTGCVPAVWDNECCDKSFSSWCFDEDECFLYVGSWIANLWLKRSEPIFHIEVIC